MRLPALVVLPLALVAAGRLGTDGTADPNNGVIPTADVAAVASVEVDPEAGSIWFCPGAVEGTSLEIANLTAADTTVTVSTAAPEGETEARQVLVRGGQALALSTEVGENGLTPSVTIEANDAAILVQQRAESSLGAAVANCATSAQTHWTFPGGQTTRGATDTLVFYNPFPRQAVVELSFTTAAGARSDRREVAVPARGTGVVDLRTEVPVEPVVSVRAEAVSGRVVAHRVIAINGADRTGLSMNLGATDDGVAWAFPVSFGGVAERYLMHNPGDSAAAIDVEVLLEVVPGTSRRQVVPFLAEVFSNAVSEFDIATAGADRLADDLPRSVIVRSDNRVPVAVEQSTQAGAVAGHSAEVGSVRAATAWSLQYHPDRGEQWYVMNPGDDATEVTVETGGDTLTTITIEARSRAVIDPATLADPNPSAVTFTSEAPVVVSVGAELGNEVSVVSAVPHTGTTSVLPGALRTTELPG
jgi:hypothetical protein